MSNSCIDPNYIKLIVQSVILDMINKHQLQAGLKDCDDGWMGAESKVVLCNTLADIIQQYIDDGTIDVKAIKSFELDGTSLVLVDQGDHTFTVDLSSILDTIADNVPKFNNCEGNPLSPGTNLMSCEQVQSAIDAAVEEAVNSLKCMILDEIHHDETLEGIGNCDTPLGVNIEWLLQFLEDEDPDIDVLDCPVDPKETTGDSLPTAMVGAPGASDSDIRAAILSAPNKFIRVHFANKCDEDEDAPKLEYYIPLYAVAAGGQQ